MNFERNLAEFRRVPIFESSLWMAGAESPQQVQRQLSDWTRAGKLVQLRRGLYVLAAPYRSQPLHDFAVANALRPASYVSLQTALNDYDLIPEQVLVTTSITTGRPGRFETDFGSYQYRHIAADLFFGFRYYPVRQNQWAFLASPEKALLDLIYLTPRGETLDYLRELRLQNLDTLDTRLLEKYAARFSRPKMARAFDHLMQLVEAERSEYTNL